MGITPLEGMVMGTRSGDLDPATLQYIMKRDGIDIEEMTNILNKKSGLLGISGISSDMRDLTAAMEEGNERATLAIKMMTYRLKKYIAGYAAAMGGRGRDRLHRRHRRKRRPHPQGGGRGPGVHGRQAR